MSEGRASFEVMVQRDNRWVTEAVRGKETEAKELALKYFADKKCEGVRIVRNWLRADGNTIENEVFCQTRVVKDDGEIRIAPLESAPPRCEATTDYYGLESRNVMSRILRPYFDKMFLTPTEVIHNYRELKRLQDKDTLVPSAVDRVAFLQTRETDQDSKARRDEILKSIEQMSARARKVEKAELPKLTENFSAAMTAVQGLADEDPGYLALVVLARDLLNLRSFAGKLERLCKLAAAETDPKALTMLDGVITDVLGANVLQEVLGWMPGLGRAVAAMFDLADGILIAEKSEAPEAAALLNRLMGESKLPAARALILDRAHRQLRSTNPLYRSDATKEMDEFNRLLKRLITQNGLYSGTETAEAVTSRYTRLLPQGGAVGRRSAIISLFRMMPDKAMGVIYLCDLARSEMGTEHAEDMIEQFNPVFQARNIADFCDKGLSPRDRMARATLAHRTMSASVYPDELKKRITDHIDGVLERYLNEHQIIEKLDHADSPLRDRAVRLVQFCAAGVLPEGKALSRARQRILTLLRQPNFDAHFVEGITDPARAQVALRDFHGLLVKAGFGN